MLHDNWFWENEFGTWDTDDDCLPEQDFPPDFEDFEEFHLYNMEF